jgi:hypothetical protein
MSDDGGMAWLLRGGVGWITVSLLANITHLTSMYILLASPCGYEHTDHGLHDQHPAKQSRVHNAKPLQAPSDASLYS